MGVNMNSVLFFLVLVSSATLLSSKHLLIETKDEDEAGMDYAEDYEDTDSEITADSRDYEDAGDYAYDGPENDDTSDEDDDGKDDNGDDGGNGKDDNDKGKDYMVN